MSFNPPLSTKVSSREITTKWIIQTQESLSLSCYSSHYPQTSPSVLKQQVHKERLDEVMEDAVTREWWGEDPCTGAAEGAADITGLLYPLTCCWPQLRVAGPVIASWPLLWWPLRRLPGYRRLLCQPGWLWRLSKPLHKVQVLYFKVMPRFLWNPLHMALHQTCKVMHYLALPWQGGSLSQGVCSGHNLKWMN